MAIPLVASPPPYVDPYADLITGTSSLFTTGVGNWVVGGGAASLTRDVTAGYRFGNLTASLKFTTTATGQYAEIPLSPVGSTTFLAGVEYHALVAACIEEPYPTPGSVSPSFSLGLQGTDTVASTGTYSTTAFFGNGVYRVTFLRWIPTVNRTGVTLRVGRIGAESGTMTWHVGFARALRLHPGTLGLGVIHDPTMTPNTTGGNDLMVGPTGMWETGFRSYEVTAGDDGWYVGSGTAGFSDRLGDNYATAGSVYAGSNNATSTRRGSTLGTESGYNIEVGPDYVGLMMAARSSTEMEIFPDWADYDVYLLDGSTNADVKHWWHEEADGTYKGSAGRKSRIGLYFQTAFHVTGAQTTGTAKNEPQEYWQLPFPTEIDEVRVHLGTAPTDATFIVDVNINGTTIFTTQSNRPTIAISGTDATSGAPDTTLFAKNDRLSIDVDQIGSTIAGSDLTVMVRGRYLW